MADDSVRHADSGDILIFPMVQRAPELLGSFKDVGVFGFLVDADQLRGPS